MNLDRVEVFRLDHPLAEPLGTARRWHSRRGALLVRVTAADGTVGWGECGGQPDVTAAAVKSFFGPRLVGREAMDTGPLFDELLERSREFGASGAYLAALSGLDLALWDLKAKLLNISVSNLLGGRARQSVTAGAGGLYARRGAEGPAAVANTAKAALDAGFASFSLKVGLGHERDLSTVRQVSRALGGGVELALDADGGLSCAEAVALGLHAGVEGCTWLEDPLAADDCASLAHLRSVLAPHGLAVAAGAGATSLETVRDLLGASDALRLDLTTCGGFSGALALLAAAKAQHRGVKLTGGQSALALAAQLALAAGSPGLGLTVECGPQPLRDDLVAGFPLREGAVFDVPTGLGLGLELEEERLALYA